MTTIFWVRGNIPLSRLSVLIFFILRHALLVESLLLSEFLIWTIIILIAVFRVIISISWVRFTPNVDFGGRFLNTVYYVGKLHLYRGKLSCLPWFYLYLWHCLLVGLFLLFLCSLWWCFRLGLGGFLLRLCLLLSNWFGWLDFLLWCLCLWLLLFGFLLSLWLFVAHFGLLFLF